MLVFAFFVLIRVSTCGNFRNADNKRPETDDIEYPPEPKILPDEQFIENVYECAPVRVKIMENILTYKIIFSVF